MKVKCVRCRKSGDNTDEGWAHECVAENDYYTCPECMESFTAPTEQYIPEGHYVVEDADGERFVKKEKQVIKSDDRDQPMDRPLPKDLPPAEYQVAAEKNPKGYWTFGMVAHVLSVGVHQVFRETVYVDKNEIPTPATTHKFKLTMSNGDEFWVEVKPIP